MRWGVALVTLILLASAGPADAKPRPKPKPDLTVSAAAVQLAGTTGLKGTVTVRNRDVVKGAAKTDAVVRTKVGRTTKVLVRMRVPALGPRRSKKLTVRSLQALKGLAAGSYRLTACIDPGDKVDEDHDTSTDNCRFAGTVKLAAATAVPQPQPQPTPTPSPTPTSQATPAPARDPKEGVPASCATPKCAPISFTKATADDFTVGDADGRYWAFVPDDYDGSTPYELLVWLHGCGGDHGELWSAADYWDESKYIAIAPDGAEGGCWDMTRGQGRVLTAIYDAISHFNIDPRRVVIGGYSSGGDLAYRTAFFHAKVFAGVLATNTSPFRDTGASAADALAAATWKFNVRHVLHTCDGTYPADGVRAELQQMLDAGWTAGVTLTKVERAGHHYDPNDDPDEGACDGVPKANLPGTSDDVQQQLVRPGMAADWIAPAQ